MPLHFTKMHGLGNDYVYVSLFDQSVPDPPALSRRISDRHRGVGSDGLILVGPSRAPGAHVRMIMYNADGSRAEMCGNGIRCVGKLAYERGWSRHNPLRVETDRGVLGLDLFVDPAGRVQRVRVDMGAPILDPKEIPTVLRGTPRSDAAGSGSVRLAVVDEPLVVGDCRVRVTCVSMGNPHAVVFVPDVDEVPLDRWGPALETHEAFPRRTNAHFVQVLAPDRVRMITWERGTGPTQACGTGAAAVCVAGVLTERTRRQITARLPGGELELEWEAAGDHVFKTGPATEICTGTWPDSGGPGELDP